MRVSLYSLRARDNHNLTRYEPRMLVVLHVVTISFAVVMLFFAVRLNASMARANVLRFVEAEVTLKPLLAPLACFALLLPALWFVLTSGVIPRDSPAHFAAVASSMATGFVALLVVVSLETTRRNALGTLTLVDAQRVRVELAGEVKELAVISARVSQSVATALSPYAQFELSDGQHTVRFVGMMALHDWRELEGPPSPPKGPLISGSTTKLYEWAKPHVTR